MSRAQKSDEEIQALVKKQLRLPQTNTSLPTFYVAELKKHIRIFPDDLHFEITPQPGSKFGILTCLEEGCGRLQISLHRNINAPEGGKKDGIGSLVAFREHINDHPTHKSNRRTRLSQSSSSSSRSLSSRSNSLHSQSETPGNAGKSRLKLISVLDNAGSPRSPSVLAASPVPNSSSPLKTSLPTTPVERRTSNPKKRLSEGGPEGPEDDERLRGVIVSSVENVPSHPSSISPKRLKIGGLKRDGVKLPLSNHDNNRSSKTPPVAASGTLTFALTPEPSSPSTTLLEASKNLQSTELTLKNWRQFRANQAKTRRLSGKALAAIRDTDMRIAELERTKAQYEAILRDAQPVQVKGESLAPAMVQLPDSSPVSASDAPDQIPGSISEDVFIITSSPSSSPVASGSSVQLPDLLAPLQTQMANDPLYRALDRLSGVSTATGGGLMGGLLDSDNDDSGNYFGRGLDNVRGPVSAPEDIYKFFQDAGNSEQFSSDESVAKALERLDLPDLSTPFPGMKVTLMPHQVIGVAWMLDKEKSVNKGGILADEMGLGKTVQMIATIMANQSDDPAIKTTLIIAPLTLLGQWKFEIESKTNNGLSVYIYHGPNKVKTKKALQKYDVVLTTFGTLAGEWPDLLAQEKAKAKAEIGKRRKKLNGFIVSDSDESDTPKLRMKAGILIEIDWYRITLDEAQYVRNKRTRTSRAVSELSSKYRWCLTGTPITNGLEDAYGLFRFLKLDPWCEWESFNSHIAKGQKRSPINSTHRLQAIFASCLLRRKKDSKLDGKNLVELPPKDVQLVKLDFTPDELNIYKQVESRTQITFNKYLRAGTVLKNYAQVLVLLLRLRQICTHSSLITEGDSEFIVVDDDLENTKEEKRAEVIHASTTMGRDWVEKLKTKLKDIALERIAAESQSADAAVAEEECPICFDNVTDPVVTGCMHTFCRECITAIVAAPAPDDENGLRRDERPCPVCRGPISEGKFFSLASFEPTDEELNIGTNVVKFEDNEDTKSLVKDEEHVKLLLEDVKPLVKDEDDDMPDILTLPSTSKEIGNTAKSNKCKGKGKGKAKRNKYRKRVIQDSDEEGDDGDDDEDDLSNFIVEDDEDEEEKDQRWALKNRLGKRRASSPVDFDSESDDDIVFGRKRAAPSGDDAPIKVLSKLLPSTKMIHMMNSLIRCASDHPDEKTMIISQWTQALDLVSNYLETKNFVHVKFQGNMSREKRDRAVRTFMRTEDTRVMLMSLKCGGVGLNLTRANRVINLDLGWSEAVENQAFDRVHRLGQERPVFVERLVINNTVEDRVLALQEKKRNLAEGSLGEGQGQKIGRLSVRELANLFGLDHRGNVLKLEG